MTLGRRSVAILIAAVAVLCLAPARSAGAQSSRVDKVLIVSTPRLTWELVAEAQPPNLTRLFGRSAVASMSMRTIGSRTTLGRGYATMGAGNRATVFELTAGLSFNASETFEGAKVDEVYSRRLTSEPAGSVLTLGLAESARRNEALHYNAHLGALGRALADGGKDAAVIANADVDPGVTISLDRGFHREAALTVMDREGRTAGGRVDSSLLMTDPTAPYGRRLDASAVHTAFAEAWSTNDVVLVELSDLERADHYGDVASSAARKEHKLDALARSDELVGRLVRHVDLSRTLVLVVTPAAPRTAEQLGVAAISGPGIDPGRARSAVTRRAGYITLPDVAPTVLDALGLDVPSGMSGTLITSTGGGEPSRSTFRALATDNTRARFRDEATGPVSVLFVVFQVLVYAAAAYMVRRRGRRVPVIAYLSLVVLAVPMLGFLSGLVRYDRLGLAGYIGALFAAAALLAAAALYLGRRRPLVAPGLLIGATLLLLLVDVVTGGRLQINTVFGYSPIVAGRFAGFGNLAFGLLAMTAIVTATVLWGLIPSRQVATWAVGAILTVVLIADGAPPWGADVGGVLAGVPAFLLVVALLRGWRIDWRKWAIAIVVTGVVVSGFALLDLTRPAASRTHLGRLIDNPENFNDILYRKITANIHILTSSIWTLIIPVALAFFLFLAVRPPGRLQALQRDVPGLRACFVGGLVTGLLAFAVNDSGVAIPAMMLAVLLPYITFLLTRSARIEA